MVNWFDKIVEQNPRSFKDGRCKYAACGQGWELLLSRAFKAVEAYLTANPNVAFHLTDIKAKYGTLRFYYDGGDDTIEAISEEAEFWSARTCEVCGKPGILEGKGWVKTSCPECKHPDSPWSRKLSNWLKSSEIEECQECGQVVKI